jgi:biotin transporter BioY
MQKVAEQSSKIGAVAYLQQSTVFGYLWKFLVLKSLVLMATFHLAFWLYKDYLTCFMMTMITSIITVGLGAVLLVAQIHVVLYNALKK